MLNFVFQFETDRFQFKIGEGTHTHTHTLFAFVYSWKLTELKVQNYKKEETHYSKKKKWGRQWALGAHHTSNLKLFLGNGRADRRES